MCVGTIVPATYEPSRRSVTRRISVIPTTPVYPSAWYPAKLPMLYAISLPW